ncbi:MAG: FAD:protein FMN transferase [Gammaproteobacteria bacterium]|nr:FAD:protein FMN transferase [Gammaproteobacteria bacterium]
MIKFFIFSLLALLLTACDNNPKEFHHSILQFGTIIDVTLYDVDEKLAAQAFKELDADFEYMHQNWTPWEPSSVSRVNSLIPTGKKFSMDPSVIPLVIESKKLAAKTDNLFNPAIGKLINLWQFHKHDQPGIAPPDKQQIDQLIQQNPQMSNLHLEGVKMYSDNPNVQLSFGAFAKGYAIDLSIKRLKQLGIDNAIINTGGDLKTMGNHGDRPWKIAIRHPRKDDIIASIEPQGEESIFTSGDYERFYMYEGKRYHHILDPNTGYPAEGTQSVTVIHHDSGLADAAATALFIAGPDHWHRMAKNLGITKVMLIDADGNVHVSPEMQQKLILNKQIQTTLIVSPPL